jgi:hypothetical protein
MFYWCPYTGLLGYSSRLILQNPATTETILCVNVRRTAVQPIAFIQYSWKTWTCIFFCADWETNLNLAMTSKSSWLHMTQAEDDSHSTVQQNSRSTCSLPYHVSNTIVIDEEEEEEKDAINNILTVSREKRRLKRIILLHPLNASCQKIKKGISDLRILLPSNIDF